MESSNNLCINCEQTTQGKFCHHCGQKQGINRLTWSNILGDLQKRLFGFDNNFLRTVKDLSIRPQAVVQSSIDGIRVRYIGAVGYYFLMVTIYILVTSFFDIDFAEMTSQYSQTINPELTTKDLESIRQLNTFVADNYRSISFLMMPFFILGIWLVFFNKGYNFLETSVLTFYGHAHPIWMMIVFLLINKFTDDFISIGFITLFSFLYTIIVAALFYKGNKLWNLVKATLGMALGFLFFMIAVVVVTYITLTINPELLKSFS